MNGYPRFGWVDILRFLHALTLHSLYNDSAASILYLKNWFGLRPMRV